MKKKYLILGGLALAAISSYGAKKGIDTYSVLGTLQTKLNAIKGLSFSATGIEMRLDIAITNPSDKPLDVSTGGTIAVRELKIFDKSNTLVATATPNLTAINIVPGGTVILEDVPVSTPYGTLLNSVISNPSTNPDDYRIETVLETLTGSQIVI